MLSYIVRRLGAAVVVLFGISLVTFIIAFAVPADPARLIVGAKASPAIVAEVRHQLGLDQPLPVQYIHYVWRLLHGDLGTSYVYNMPVASLIGQRIGGTVLLAVACWLAELIIGIPLGIYTARRARTWIDYAVSALALVGISLFVPWLGEVLLYLFAFKLPVFPLGGTGGIRHLILPALTYGITGAAVYTRLLKSSMLEVLGQDYVRTARAKGASEQRVIWRHVVRNALIPVVTVAGIDIGTLLSGVVLIEVTFNWNGLGSLATEAISQLDIPVIMGTVLFTAVLVVLFNLLVDILYVFIDPRIRYD
ncbi:glutathione ABC transporter permease [Alicyclobacillus cellulosilyticus]|uniref:Glutathione ABC transporter permease n=1 Tax=Alicyclobacillus cellulosilyticus TaxID=1003997 RepID=A0A917NFX5_9BACL|nr:ABC transporter permease [Alicyclobacillus cellulosilyticus]GGI97499.1 glutathione ABC transporter permease [Alicyclobacillus cellulosilyticus]